MVWSKPSSAVLSENRFENRQSYSAGCSLIGSNTARRESGMFASQQTCVEKGKNKEKAKACHGSRVSTMRMPKAIKSPEYWRKPGWSGSWLASRLNKR